MFCFCFFLIFFNSIQLKKILKLNRFPLTLKTDLLVLDSFFFDIVKLVNCEHFDYNPNMI